MMDDLYINKNKTKTDSNFISNVYSFTSISSNTNNTYISTSTSYRNKSEGLNNKNKSTNFYCINLDWFQFLCRCDKNGAMFESYSTARINIKKMHTDHNPNFTYEYIVYLDSIELCEIWTVPKNRIHKKDEFRIKINNSQLYTGNWPERINFVMDELGLIFLTLTKVDIAVDGCDIYTKMEYFRRFLRTKTVHIKNDNLKVEGNNFNKTELKWDSYTIGSKKYQKYAKIYIKSSELIVSGKQYIIDFWEMNEMDTNDKVGRFELKLGTRHLKKYKVSSFNDFCNAGYIGRILKDEVYHWLKLYKVRLNDIKKHRKDIAIRKSGEELILIHWDKLPKTTIQLETVNNVTDNIRETKRTITHTISEIQKGYSVNYTYTLINFVEAITTEYNLYNHTITKISDAINNNPSGKEELTYLKERLTDLSMKEIESENI